MAAQPTVQVRPHDPLRTFQFRIKFQAEGPTDYIAGVRAVSGLTWTVASYETWSGGNNLHPYATPNRVSYEPIVLEQGIARDDSLEAWAEAARAMAEEPHGERARGARRTLQIDVWDRAVLGGAAEGAVAGAIVHSYLVFNAWVSKYVALPRLDAMSSEIAVASVEIVHEGWRRKPPTE